MEVGDIRNIKKCADGYLLGTTTIAGVDFHCLFIRVRQNEDTGEQFLDLPTDEDGEVNDPECIGQIWEDMCCLDSGPFQTIHVPEYEGYWVLVIHPYGD